MLGGHRRPMPHRASRVACRDRPELRPPSGRHQNRQVAQMRLDLPDTQTSATHRDNSEIAPERPNRNAQLLPPQNATIGKNLSLHGLRQNALGSGGCQAELFREFSQNLMDFLRGGPGPRGRTLTRRTVFAGKRPKATTPTNHPSYLHFFGLVFCSFLVQQFVASVVT